MRRASHHLRALAAGTAALTVTGLQTQDLQCRESATPSKLTFRLCSRGPGGYTPVFLASPLSNTASVNINTGLLRSYAQSTGNVGRKADVYDTLYSALLTAALQKPGELQSLEEAGGAAQEAARALKLVACFARAPPSASGPVCAVFIDIFQEAARPLSRRNVALVFVEAPSGRATTKDASLPREEASFMERIVARASPGVRERAVFAAKEDFLAAVELAARNAMSAVVECNRSHGSGSALTAPIPRIEVLQYCVVSGATAQRHPDCSKLEVAMASLRGLGAGAGDTAEHVPEVLLSYDENVYAEALKTLKIVPAN